MATTLSPELIELEGETRDERNLKQGEVDKASKLVTLDKALPKATVRIDT